MAISLGNDFAYLPLDPVMGSRPEMQLKIKAISRLLLNEFADRKIRFSIFGEINV